MTKQVFWLIPLLFATVNASSMTELKQCKSSDELARFMFRLVTEEVKTEDLLVGIRSSEKIRIPSYTIEIPIREIYGTIVLERFGNVLGRNLLETGKTYKTREICCFLDDQGLPNRFHITIFDSKQYTIMEEFLLKELAKNRGVVTK
jgi:hypothetical protein